MNNSSNQQRDAKSLTNEEFLIQTDAFTNNYINMCNDADNKSDPPFIDQCVDLLVSPWYAYCNMPVYHDKLEFCKNGKLEGYLKKHGKL
jgi:hypothetical protein